MRPAQSTAPGTPSGAALFLGTGGAACREADQRPRLLLRPRGDPLGRQRTPSPTVNLRLATATAQATRGSPGTARFAQAHGGWGGGGPPHDFVAVPGGPGEDLFAT